MCKFSSRGQFFSPDLAIAVGVFVFGLALFLNASNSIFLQADLLDARKDADETAHRALNSLVLSAGYPFDWQNYSLADVNSIGLASSPNFLDLHKTLILLADLNSDLTYAQAKSKLGLGQYDLYLDFLDNGAKMSVNGVVLEGGKIAAYPKVQLSYTRLVYINNTPAVLEAVVSLQD
jgi:hypothetical protein